MSVRYKLGVTMTDIIKSKDFVDSFADVFLTTAVKVGENSYCKIIFCRHVIDYTKIPDESNPTGGSDFFLEATQSITLPMSMAKNLAKGILNAQEAPDTSLMKPFETKI